MIYMVSYDLPFDLFRNTAPFLQQLQNTDDGRTWWHFLTNTWLISTNETAHQLFERLHPHTKPSDRLLIMAVSPEYTGLLPQEAWQWIQQQYANGGFSYRPPSAFVPTGR